MRALIKRGDKLLAEAEVIYLPYLDNGDSISFQFPGALRLTAGSPGDLRIDSWTLQTEPSTSLGECLTADVAGSIITFVAKHPISYHPEESEHTLKV